MKKLILGIGIPASGKSTFLEPFAMKNGYKYICVDKVRAEFQIDRDNPLASTDNPATFEVWDEIRFRTQKYLLEENSVIVDATFAKPELRQEFIEIGSRNGAKVTGFFLDVCPDIAWERNLLREQKVPEQVFWERVSQIQNQPPSIQDGFDSIFMFSEQGYLRAQNGTTRLFKLFNQIKI